MSSLDDLTAEEELQNAQSAARSLSELQALVAGFNVNYAVVNEAGKVMVFEQIRDPLLERNVLVRTSFADFRKLYQNTQLTIVTPKGKKITKSHADWWLDHQHRRQFVKGVVFDPTGKIGPPHYWNLWSGWPIPPAPGDWSLMRQHILEVICSGNERYFHYVIRWIAFMVQHPELQGRVALVLRVRKVAAKASCYTICAGFLDSTGSTYRTPNT
jgi:hypothetical protein